MIGWRSTALLSGILIALVLFRPAAAHADPASVSPGSHAVAIQLKWTHQFQFAGFYAALAQGYYADAGLDVRLIEGGPQLDPAQVVVDGEADFGVGNSSLLVDRAEGVPVVAVAAIFQHSPFIILARREPDLLSLSQLEGRRLMVEEHSAELLAYLAIEGVDIDRVRSVTHSGDPQALGTGEVDAMTAYTTTEPYELIASRVPYRIFNPRSAGIDHYGDTLFTIERIAASEPAIVRAVREATLKGWRYALAHSDEIIEIILSDYAPESDRRRLEFEAEEIRRLMISDVVDIGYMSETRWRNIADGFAKAGLVPEGFSLEGFLFDPRPRSEATWLYPWIGALIVLVLVASLVAHRFYRLNRTLTREVEARRHLEAELLHLAATDSLTGIANRRRLLERTGEELRRARRFGHPLALLLVDLDHFKRVNDNWGHATGDRALLRVAEICGATVRDIDLAARLGGEEFAVLLPVITPEAAKEVGERLRRAIETIGLEADDGTPIPLTASIGVAVMASGDTPESLLGRADQAMYEAKRSGRNRMIVWKAA